jgi:hypothetical protein
MTKPEGQQITYAIADLEALREFSPPLDPHKPKLDRAIDRLNRMLKKKDKPADAVST